MFKFPSRKKKRDDNENLHPTSNSANVLETIAGSARLGTLSLTTLIIETENICVLSLGLWYAKKF